MSSYYTYRGRPERVIDGDTLEVYLDQGFNDYTVKTIRLRDVDTAEIWGVSKDSEEYERGMEQKHYVEEFVTSDAEWPLSVRTFGKGKYGRWVGYVWVDGENLSQALERKWPSVTVEQ